MSLTPPGPPPSTPPPAGPPEQSTGWLMLTLQGSVMTSNLITPAVRLNGYVMPARYGPNLYPLPPGPWRVEVHTQWLRQYGQASMDVQVPVGQTLPVFYAAPWHQFATGNIGYTKQSRKGLGVFVVIIAALVAALVAMFVGVLA